MFRRNVHLRLLLLVGAALSIAMPARFAAADPPGKTRVKREKDRPGRDGDRDRDRVPRDREPPGKARPIPPDAVPPHRVRPGKSYVRTRRDYGHVRVSRYPRENDGHMHIRPIVVRSARVSPVVLNRFERRDQDQIRTMIKCLRDNRRGQAMEIWASFVSGLSDYHQPVDLDEVMLYVAREGCFYGSDRVLFRAAKLEHLRESADRVGDYEAVLRDQQDACRSGLRTCSPETMRDIEMEMTQVRADRQILDIRARALDDEFETVIASSREYEQSFARTYEDMYREVEVRISFSP